MVQTKEFPSNGSTKEISCARTNGCACCRLVDLLVPSANVPAGTSVRRSNWRRTCCDGALTRAYGALTEASCSTSPGGMNTLVVSSASYADAVIPAPD
jgi:hypothetical protein